MKGPPSSDSRDAIYSMVRSPPAGQFGVSSCRVGTRSHRSRFEARTQLSSINAAGGLTGYRGYNVGFRVARMLTP